MAEEKKDKAEGAKPKKEAPKKEAPKEEAQAPSGEKKNKKINQMTLAEIETKLGEIKQAQGGLASGYARQLMRRKRTLGS